MTEQTTAQQWANLARACDALAAAVRVIGESLGVETPALPYRPERILVAGPSREAVDGWVDANREHLWSESGRLTKHVIGHDSVNHLRGHQWDHVFIVGSHLPDEHRTEILVGLRGSGRMRVASTLDRLRPDWRDS